MPDDSAPCPCGSGSAYGACCGPFHSGAEPATAVQLMRARYAAFASSQPAFLIRTSQPQARARLLAEGFRSSFALDWCGLEIVAHEAGGPDDDEGFVHFRARYRDPLGDEQVHDERSRFLRIDGAWIYRDAAG